jgi:acetyl-CoA acyltransferase
MENFYWLIKKMSEVFIVECVRTPIGLGRENGSLNKVHPINLLAKVLEEVVKRAGIDKKEVEDIVCGISIL